MAHITVGYFIGTKLAFDLAAVLEIGHTLANTSVRYWVEYPGECSITGVAFVPGGGACGASIVADLACLVCRIYIIEIETSVTGCAECLG